MNFEKNIFAILATTLLTATSSYATTIEPSQAFGTALSVVLNQLPRAVELDNLRVYQVDSIGIGKYSEGSFGDYTVALSVTSASNENAHSCSAALRIEKVPFAKQDAYVVILEGVTNDYQVIAKIHHLTCKPL